MFIKKFVHRRVDGSSSTYLVMVRSYRQGKQVYQQELCRLGKLEDLQASGQLDRLIQGLARLSQRRWVIADEIASPPEKSP